MTELLLPLNRTQLDAVTFDAGGTLIQPWPSVGHIYASVAERQGHGQVPPEALTAAFHAAWRQQPNFDYSYLAWSRLVARTFSGHLPSGATDAFFSALHQEFNKPEVWRIYDDVQPTLARLRNAGFKLGLLSNWDERLAPLLEKLGLAQQLDTCTISCHAGAQKPDGEIFRKAAAELALPPDRICHIGDGLSEDYKGARDAGFHSVWLNRGRDQSASARQVRSLEELL